MVHARNSSLSNFQQLFTAEKKFIGIKLFAILIVLPITVFLAMQEQDNRQKAASLDNLASNYPPEGTDPKIPGQFMVKFKNTTSAQGAQASIEEIGGDVVSTIDPLNIKVIKVPVSEGASAQAALVNDPNIEYVEQDYMAYGDFTPNDSSFNLQYGFHNSGQDIRGIIGKNDADIDLPEAWDKTKGTKNGQKIKVAVLDSGIDQDHPELQSKIVEPQKNFTDSTTIDDVWGHGTHVAGIVGAVTNNGTGVSGTCPDCVLLNVKALSDTNTSNHSIMSNALIFAADNGAKVITMSISSTTSTQTLQDAVNYAWNKGVIIFTSAGNAGNTSKRYPAAYDNVIAVAMTNNNDEKDSASTYGDWVDLAAPGRNVYSTLANHDTNSGWGKNYGYLSGTSMSTPMAAGLAALVWSTDYGTTNQSVRSRIESTADKISGTGSYWIHGRINAAKAVGVVATPCPLNSQSEGKLVSTGDVDVKKAPGRIIVRYKNGQSLPTSIEERIKKYEAKQLKRFEKINSRILEVKKGDEDKAIQELKGDSSVAYAEPDYIGHAVEFSPNDESFNKQYGLKNTGQSGGTSGADIKVTLAWDKTRGTKSGQKIKVAVLDSGIDQDHPDVASKIIMNKNFVTKDGGRETVDDIFGHGTHVAGILAAVTNNTSGVAGVCPDCELLNGKVLDDTGNGFYSHWAEGIMWAADNGAKVINMSVAGTSSSQTLTDAVAYANSKGAIVVAAAGNSATTAKSYPAAIEGVIAVGSTTNTDQKSSFSNYGSDWVDVAAPGTNIYATLPNHTYAKQSAWGSNYGALNGTSMATPMVAGTLALIWATEHGTTASAVRTRLESTTDIISANQSNWKFGRINAAKAVGVTSSSPNPTQILTPTPSPFGPTIVPDPCKTPSPTNPTTPIPTAGSNTPTPTNSPTSLKIQGKYIDKNGNPITVPGQKITFYRCSSRTTCTTPLDQKETTSSPNWSFTNLDKGIYVISATQLPGYTLSYSFCSNCATHPTFNNGYLFGIDASQATPGDYMDIQFKYTSGTNITPSPTIPSGVTPTIIIVPSTMPTPTPTRAPSIIPTHTPMPTTTPNPLNTNLAMTVLIHGIGRGGDNVNPGSPGNQSPIRQQREINVTISDNNDQQVATTKGIVTYNPSSGNFTGTISIPNLQSGNYLIRVATQSTLTQLATKVYELKKGQTTTIDQITLITGDINGDNKLNIFDYNLLMQAYTACRTNCNYTQHISSDLDDNGKIDGVDYNLLLRNFSVQNGK